MKYVFRYLISLAIVIACWFGIGTFSYWGFDWAEIWKWAPYDRGGLIVMILSVAGLGALCPAWEYRK